MEPRGPVDYPLAELEPGRFESLVFLLASATDPRVVPVRVRDHGLDARLPDPRGRTLRGWQAKRFAGAINWEQCRQSVRRALAFWRPPHITFGFPRDLSAAEQESFRTELIERFPHVRLDFWPGGELQRLIRDTEGGRRAAAWLFSNPAADREAMLRAMALGGELADSRQAAERQAVIQEFMDRDPHVHYTMISRSPGGPMTPPADATFLSITREIAGQEVRIDASPRYTGALEDLGAAPLPGFTNDEAGRQAFDTFQRLAREGGRATISAGLGAIMPSVPIGLRGLMPEDGVWGVAEVVVGEPLEDARPEFAEPILLRAGEHELGIVLVPTDPADEWDATLHGATGGLELFYSLRKPADAIESRLAWRYTIGEGSALEQLLAGRLMLAALGGELMEFVRPGDGHVVVAATLDPPDGAATWREELETRDVFLRYVAELEAWLGRSLSPPARPSESDAAVLAQIIPRIRHPESSITWREVELAPGASSPGEDPFQLSVLQPLHARLFEEDVYVGMELLHLPAARVEEVGDHLTLVPVDGTGSGTSHLHRPEEIPAEAATGGRRDR